MIQIDGRGFIKGTNQLFKEVVITLQPISIKGNIISAGEKIELVGAELIDAKNRGLVRAYNPEIDEPKEVKGETQEVPTLETIVVEEKLGPKKRKKSKKVSEDE